jgi:hypothetical protein
MDVMMDPAIPPSTLYLIYFIKAIYMDGREEL